MAGPKIKRHETVAVTVGNVVMGGNHPIVVQSMTNTDTADLEATVAVATKPEGLRYPPGSVVQLIPTEAMVKHHEGWNAATNDWEFFELDVTEAGTRIKVRGTTEVVNKFGGNCFGCHQKAAPQWDLICEEGHGCDPLPIPDFLIHRAQRKDPRCK